MDAALSPRELEVLRLRAEGWSDGEVATRLGLARATVAHHVASAYRKLDVHQLVEALRALGWLRIPA